MERASLGQTPGRVNPVGGVYGFRLPGLDDPTMLPAVPPDWPCLRVVREPPGDDVARAPGSTVLSDDRAVLWLAPGTVVHVERETLTVRIRSAQRPDDRLVLHPLLGGPAAVAGHWIGREALHGGAFAHGGSAWAVLGQVEAGKSSLLAWLVRSGATLLSDDVLLVEDGQVFAGPRCIDLRASTAQALGATDMADDVRPGRWRLATRKAPVLARLAGFVHLSWGDGVAMERLSLTDRLGLLSAQRMVPGGQERPQAYLDLAALPAWRLVRPRDLRRMDEVVDQLLGALG